MITVSRLDGSEIIVNAELIQFIESTPDSIITMVDGNKLVVLESAEEIVERVIEYRRRTYGRTGGPPIQARRPDDQE